MASKIKRAIPITTARTNPEKNSIVNILLSNLKCIKKATTITNFIKDNTSIIGIRSTPRL